MPGIKDFAEDEVRNLRAKLKSRRGVFLWLVMHWQSLAIGAAVLFFSAWLWHWYSQKPEASVGVAVVATEAPALKHAPVEYVIPKKPMKVRTGEKLKKKLNLSEVNIKNPDWTVAAASTLPPSEHERDVITGLNTTTGELETDVVTKPLPWIAFTTKGDVMLAGGVNASGEQAGMVQVRQGVLRIKDVTLGVVGTVSHANNGAGGHSDAAGMFAAWYGYGR